MLEFSLFFKKKSCGRLEHEFDYFLEKLSSVNCSVVLLFSVILVLENI